MRIVIGAIGTLKNGPELDLIDDYCHRFAVQGRQLGLPSLTVREFEVARNLKGIRRQDAEADLLMSTIPAAAAIFILDETGKAMSSISLSQNLEKLKDTSHSEVWFLIGGADGHGNAVRDAIRAGRTKTLSFGSATWPHMLVRVMLAEQLYRAATILSGHPYHRN